MPKFERKKKTSKNMRAKYINPFTDFGFKKIFGEEANKVLLLDFLNALLPQERTIVDLSFKNAEQLGLKDYNRNAVFDIYCENERGEKFIVELQKAKQNYFKERMVFYSTFPIREQAEKGEWNYDLKAVYCIGILDFKFDDYKGKQEANDVIHTVKLKNQHGTVFYDKLTYVYLEMPNFVMQEHELTTRLDKWLFFIKNLEDFQNIPIIFKDAIFTQAFETAEIAKMNVAEMDSYERSLKVFRDNYAVYEYAVETARKQAKEDGIEIGEQKSKLQIAQNLLTAGISIELISKATGLTIQEIKVIQNKPL